MAVGSLERLIRVVVAVAAAGGKEIFLAEPVVLESS
jgi:hypothetical protein